MQCERYQILHKDTLFWIKKSLLLVILKKNAEI